MTQNNTTNFDSNRNYYEILNELVILQNKVIHNPKESLLLRTEILKCIFSIDILKTEFVNLVEKTKEHQTKNNIFERANYVHETIKSLYNMNDSEINSDIITYLYFPSITIKDEHFEKHLVVCNDLMQFYSIANIALTKEIIVNKLYNIEYCAVIDPSFISTLRSNFDKYYLATCLYCILTTLILHIEYHYCKIYYHENIQKKQKADSVIKKIKEYKHPTDLFKIIKEILIKPEISIVTLASNIGLTEESTKNRIRDLSEICKIKNGIVSVKHFLKEYEPYLKI